MSEISLDSADDVIKTERLTRRFGTHRAVELVDLTVGRGQIYGFLGPNGAGKTTTIRMLLGLIKPDSGDIQLFGQSLRDRRQAILKRVGALIEAPSFYPNLTGRENLDIARRLLRVSSRRVDEVLDMMSLLDAASRPASTYSMGMKQRLGLAKALLHQPDLLILDEPTNGMDPAGIREMRQWMLTLPERAGVTVFMSSHILSEVQAVATHIGIIRQGRLVFEGAMSDLHERIRPVLRIKTDDNVRARSLLSEQVEDVQIDDDALLVSVAPERAGALNRYLMNAGVVVSELSPREKNLEDIFFQMTDTMSAQTEGASSR